MINYFARNAKMWATVISGAGGEPVAEQFTAKSVLALELAGPLAMHPMTVSLVHVALMAFIVWLVPNARRN